MCLTGNNLDLPNPSSPALMATPGGSWPKIRFGPALADPTSQVAPSTHSLYINWSSSRPLAES